MRKVFLFIAAAIMMAACNNKQSNNEPQVEIQTSTDSVQSAAMNADDAELLAYLDSIKCSCVVRNNGTTTHYTQSGVRDLYELVTTKPEVLDGAQIADKIIGKGAAALMVNGKVKRATTHVITTPALKMLTEAGIEVYFEEQIPFVENRKKTGQCPLDSRLQEVDDAAQALPVIEQFIKDLNDGKVL